MRFIQLIIGNDAHYFTIERARRAAALIALYRHNELPSHLKRAIENGVTRDEIVEPITQLAFYGGWPVAIAALPIAREVFEESGIERHERSEANFGEIS